MRMNNGTPEKDIIERQALTKHLVNRNHGFHGAVDSGGWPYI